jgi:hypothetical protein
MQRLKKSNSNLLAVQRKHWRVPPTDWKRNARVMKEIKRGKWRTDFEITKKRKKKKKKKELDIANWDNQLDIAKLEQRNLTLRK